YDRWVAELRGAAGLTPEPIAIFVSSQATCEGDFDSHHAVELRVAGPVHRAEGPDADGLDQLEAAQPPLAPARAPGDGRLPLQPAARAAGRADRFPRVGGQVDQLDRVAAVRADYPHAGPRRLGDLAKRGRPLLELSPFGEEFGQLGGELRMAGQHL